MQAHRRFKTAQANDLPGPEQRKISDPGAPVFYVGLEATAILKFGEGFKVKVHITLNENDYRPSSAIFHTALINSAFRLARYRRSQDSKELDEINVKNSLWEPYTLKANGSSVLADGDDVRVNVSQHKDFTFIHAGES